MVLTDFHSTENYAALHEKYQITMGLDPARYRSQEWTRLEWWAQ
jgi:hypothetical protein